MKEMYYPSVGQFVLLEDINLKRKVLCANTHLLFNKNRGHTKLGMIVLILKIASSLLKNQAKDAAFIFAGDFNLFPNSMLYNWLSGRGLNLTTDLREYSNQAFFMTMSEFKDPIEISLHSDRKYKFRNPGKSAVMNSFL